jgi:hypothetical protein
MVKDWSTLVRWIHEGRVDPKDLLSEGGVDWSVITERSELAKLFPDLQPAVPPIQDTFRAPPAEDDLVGWRDDDTAGIPTGLPALPMEEVHELPPPEHSDPLVAVPNSEVDDSSPSHRIETPHAGLIKTRSKDIDPPQLDGINDDTAAPPEPRNQRPSQLPTIEPLPHRGTQQEATADDQQVVETGDLDPDSEISESLDDEFLDAFSDFDHSEETPRNDNVPLLAFAGAAAVTLLVVIGIGTWIAGSNAPDPTQVRQPDQVPGTPLVAPAPKPEPEPEPEPTQVPAPSDAPAAPTVEPTEQPVPPSPAPQPTSTAAPPVPAVNFRGLLDQGWATVDADPGAAEAAFRQILARKPAHAEANYGLGYTMLSQGDKTGSAQFLCAAQGSSDISIRRDVAGLISRNGLSCE